VNELCECTPFSHQRMEYDLLVGKMRTLKIHTFTAGDGFFVRERVLSLISVASLSACDNHFLCAALVPDPEDITRKMSGSQ
jgi:hypothetical protein